MPPPRRWHATTLNDQFGTFGGAVSEYSFELTPDAVLTCGALAVHPGVCWPKKGGKRRAWVCGGRSSRSSGDTYH